MGSRQPFVAAKHKEAAEDEGRDGSNGHNKDKGRASGIRATGFHHGNSPENCMDKHRWLKSMILCLGGKLPNRYMLAMCAEKDWADRELSQS